MNDKIIDIANRFLEDETNPDWNGLLTELYRLGYNEAEAHDICYRIRQGEY